MPNLPTEAAMKGKARDARVPWRYRRQGERFVEGNRVTLLRDGAEAFPAMRAAIERAEQQVLLEMYWFASDATGRAFAAALRRAAARGVQVAVLYDAVGSWESDPGLFADLAAAGVEVVEFHP
ncbi:MAG TPA: phospholipase D-like domain-containing protein, partial [Polyangiaceae bacterium]|nr:phospholipase D-like domain-containing protein [Polyangiaceae bacterium]